MVRINLIKNKTKSSSSSDYESQEYDVVYKDSEISESDLNISVHDDSDTSDLIT